MHNIVPGTPAELAKPFAEQFFLSEEIDNFAAPSNHEQASIVELEEMADSLKMLGEQYIVHSHRSLVIPKHFEAGDPAVAHHSFNDGLDFYGELLTYSTVRIGRLLGRSSVRAVCLTFQNATLLPYFDQMEESDLLYTPVFAIADMERVS